MINVPYGVGGSDARRDHIYLPKLTRSQMEAIVNVEDPGLDTDAAWAVELSLAQMLAIFWRVRKWRWSGTWSATATADDGPQVGKTSSMSSTITQTPTPSVLVREGGVAGGTLIIPPNDKEFLLVSHNINSLRTPPRYGTDLPYSTLRSFGPTDTANPGINMSYTADDNSTDVTPPGHITGNDAFTSAFSMNGFAKGVDIVVWTGAKFVPYANLGSMARTTFHLVAGARTTPPPSVPVVGTGTITVDPVIAPSFDLSVYLTAIFTGASSATASASLTFSLTAIEFHPFVNRLGQAIYDTSTGAQVSGVDPFA